MLEVRKATSVDVPAIMTVLEAAKGIMRASGNQNQWVNGYPSEAVIQEDIAAWVGYVVVSDADASVSSFRGLSVGSPVVGYFAFIPSPEPTYATIYGGAWLDDSLPYHVIHRIGSLPSVHGVFAAMLDYCSAIDGNLRIDTHRDNRIMQHLLEKHGFRYCGIIYLLSGDERLAYQRL